MKTVGLTLGKFAPFHQGHQHVVECALRETDHVIVMIYDCPETTSVPLTVRSRWIRTLYPEVEVVEGWDGPAEMGDTPEIQQRHEEYILRILGNRRVTHFFNSEFYGDHVGKVLNAINRTVDEGRTLFPISGTDIRNNPYEYRAFLTPCVYRDLITNVVFLGAPSTGKTTIAETMAKRFGTVWMPEYGREYWDEHQVDRRLSLTQLVEISGGHLEREEKKLLEANRFLFTDTNAITTYIFSLYYHGVAEPRLEELARHSVKRYDVFFLCEDDLPYDDTWDRSGEGNRRIFQRQIIADLIERKIPFFRLRGILDERIKHVELILDGFDKYRSLPDQFEWKRKIKQLL